MRNIEPAHVWGADVSPYEYVVALMRVRYPNFWIAPFWTSRECEQLQQETGDFLGETTWILAKILNDQIMASSWNEQLAQ